MEILDAAIAAKVPYIDVHGTLHLLGYDHETDRGQMARAERLWGRRLGLASTLIARQYRKVKTTRKAGK